MRAILRSLYVRSLPGLAATASLSALVGCGNGAVGGKDSAANAVGGNTSASSGGSTSQAGAGAGAQGGMATGGAAGGSAAAGASGADSSGGSSGTSATSCDGDGLAGAGSATRPSASNEEGCSIASGNGFEGHPGACVSTGQCSALTHVATYCPEGTPPDLALGVPTDIGPPVGPLGDGGGALALTIDPSNTAILYAGLEFQNGGSPNNGLWRSKDGGASWTRLGTSDDNAYDCHSNYMDLPIRIEVDPENSDHLYLTEGVRGAGNGFWVSWDAGESWIRARSGDFTEMSVDPCDFCHVIVGSHASEPVGVLESTDGGYTWIDHPPPAGQGWSGGSYGLSFLHDPATCQGDPSTWLVHNEAMWKTSDSGGNWTKVSDIGGIHGFTTIYYASNGDVYSGAYGRPGRSTDNGDSWAEVDGLISAVYYGLTGDGTNVYAMPDGFPAPGPMMSSPESVQNWTEFGNKQALARGMQHPRFDPLSGNIYFVNNVTVYAVRVAEPSAASASEGSCP
ncbi:MAG TPA: hypothetical protein VGP93_14705 [Polyangiaceae bacterium]|nr:hypothetical protein [Polyangiaceae bacterium]